jgi:hypothetical protein
MMQRFKSGSLPRRRNAGRNRMLLPVLHGGTAVT